ncbi:DUF397 domain-containing protein [Actinoplanes sp. NPDC026619]|uniref:DUF397 domain-containing protein n=1 Tax=Actinoplanes sp. NPDC026619 TaxID=3155798 RepID=UPI0033F83257
MAQVEVSGVWRKSTRSNGSGNCVEVGRLTDGTIGVRDSKDRTGPILKFTPADFAAFISGVKDDGFRPA